MGVVVCVLVYSLGNQEHLVEKKEQTFAVEEKSIDKKMTGWQDGRENSYIFLCG